MAITFGDVAGYTSDASSGSSIVVTLTEEIPAGAFVVVAAAIDNTGSSAPTMAVVGNRYLVQRAASTTGGTGQASGADLRVHHSWHEALLALPVDTTITVSLGAAATNRIAVVLWYESDLTLPKIDTPNFGVSGSTSGTTQQHALTVTAGDFEVLARGAELDTVTLDTNWTTRWSGGLGSGTTGMFLAVQDKVADSSGTLNNTATAGTSTGWGSIASKMLDMSLTGVMLPTAPILVPGQPGPRYGQLWPLSD